MHVLLQKVLLHILNDWITVAEDSPPLLMRREARAGLAHVTQTKGQLGAVCTASSGSVLCPQFLSSHLQAVITMAGLNPLNLLKSAVWRAAFALRESGQALERVGCKLQGIYSFDEVCKCCWS